MNDGAIVKDGKLVVDMAKAEELWSSLDPLKQAELTNMMFQPVLENAKTMRLALLAIIEKCDQNGARPEIKAIAQDALPK